MSSSFIKFGGLMGVLAGLSGLVYLISFILTKNPAAVVPSIALLLLGLFASATIVAIYQHVRAEEEGFALWGLLLGVGGAGGAAIHAAFDLNNNLHPPEAPFGYASPIDPRGFMTFAVAGLAAVVLSWLILRAGTLPGSVGYFGILSGVLLIALYLAYLIILNASNPLVYALVLASGLAQPIWYVWIGWLLWQGEAKMPARMASVRR